MLGYYNFPENQLTTVYALVGLRSGWTALKSAWTLSMTGDHPSTPFKH